MSEQISTGKALRLGLSLGFGLWPAGLAAFGAACLEVLAEALLALGIWAWFLGSTHALAPAVGAWISLWLFAQLLRVLVQGAAIQQGRSALEDKPPNSFPASVLMAAKRSLVFLLWAFVLDLALVLWRWVALIAGAWAFISALRAEKLVGLSSASLALALSLGLLLGLVWALWKREAFVRSVAFDQSALVSFHEGAWALAHRMWPRLGVLSATVLFAAIAELIIASMAGSLSPPFEGLSSVSLTFSVELVTGILAAFVGAISELAALQGFVALQLDEKGLLPQPLPPPVPPMATLIPDAQLLPDPPSPG